MKGAFALNQPFGRNCAAPWQEENSLEVGCRRLCCTVRRLTLGHLSRPKVQIVTRGRGLWQRRYSQLQLCRCHSACAFEDPCHQLHLNVIADHVTLATLWINGQGLLCLLCSGRFQMTFPKTCPDYCFTPKPSHKKTVIGMSRFQTLVSKCRTSVPCLDAQIAKSQSQQFQITIKSRNLRSQTALQNRSRIASKSFEKYHLHGNYYKWKSGDFISLSLS